MSVLEAMALAYGREVFGDGNRMPESVARVVTSGLRAALAEARRQGWQLVPVEADKNMMIAGAAAITAYVKDDETDAGDVHRAMIAAAPDVEG